MSEITRETLFESIGIIETDLITGNFSTLEARDTIMEYIDQYTKQQELKVLSNILKDDFFQECSGCSCDAKELIKKRIADLTQQLGAVMSNEPKKEKVKSVFLIGNMINTCRNILVNHDGTISAMPFDTKKDGCWHFDGQIFYQAKVQL